MEDQTAIGFYHENVVFLECIRAFIMAKDPHADIRFRERHTMLVRSVEKPAYELLKSAIYALVKNVEEHAKLLGPVADKARTVVISDLPENIAPRVASLIRYCLMNCIPSYAAGEIVEGDLLVNTSATTTEEIVGRAALIPLIVNTPHDELLLEKATITIEDENELESTRYTKSDKMTCTASDTMTTDNLLIPTKPNSEQEYGYRLAILPAGAKLWLSMHVERGTGKDHSKFQTTSKVTLHQNDDGEYEISFEIVGQLSHTQCFDKVLEYIEEQQYISIQQVKEVDWLPCIATKDPSAWYRPSSYTNVTSSIPLRVCEISTSETLLKLKNEFGMIPVKRRNVKRDQINPFSAVDDAIKSTGRNQRTGSSDHMKFIDRAVSKIMEIDTTYRLLDTAAAVLMKQQQQDGQIPEKKMIVADIASGPGSWSEYILWRTTSKSWDDISVEVKGFTLVDNHQENHFRVNDERFEDLSRSCGGSGNVMKESKKLGEHVDGLGGADIVLCDGGTPDHRANQDELANIDLIRGEFAAAIGMLKDGGSMVCKLFMTETRETVATLSIVADCFTSFTITKPVASRPSNSEQYFVGLGFKKKERQRACERLWVALEFGHTDVLEVHTSLVSYINHINEQRSQLQSKALESIIMQRANIDRAVQLEIKETCMAFWGIPTDDDPEARDTEEEPHADNAGNDVDEDGRQVEN